VRGPDWTIAQDWQHYTPAEHALWARLWQRQTQLLPGRACDAFLSGMRVLPIDGRNIPDFAALNEILLPATGWQVVAVPGLLPDEVFFAHLAARRFPAGRFIRSAVAADYLQEPDVFHDVFGHVPMLMNPALADFIQAYGEGGLRAQRLGVLPYLARVYWYTVEFGLVEQPDGLRLYGAGIASSYAESRFAIDDPSPHRLAFELLRVMRTRYRIDDFQEAYFVLKDLDALLDLARIDFAPLYLAAAALPELEPGAVGLEDRLIVRGSGDYHRRSAG
jgi:phenylalanine-4-hydroxylase